MHFQWRRPADCGHCGAGLAQRNLEILVNERDGAQQVVSERRVQGVWPACGHTKALHVRACIVRQG
jgi:hypothetical protein